MYLRGFCKSLHTTKIIFQASDLSPLSILRKKTGYTFSNIKKALELHSNDVKKAEEWLHSQAKSQGWAKVTKLKDRVVSEGLIGLICNENNAAMVEVNCETDFVARNENFQSMLISITHSALNYSTNKKVIGHEFSKSFLSPEDLCKLKTPDASQTLGDLIALNVGLLGENITLRRALCLSVGENMQISTYIHPPLSARQGVSLGRFGGVVVFRKLPDAAINGEMTLEEAGREISKHVVGMNPKKIGCKEDKPSENSDEESTLIYQECINNPDQTMGEFIDQNGIQVLDFTRFQSGEELIQEKIEKMERK